MLNFWTPIFAQEFLTSSPILKPSTKKMKTRTFQNAIFQEATLPSFWEQCVENRAYKTESEYIPRSQKWDSMPNKCQLLAKQGEAGQALTKHLPRTDQITGQAYYQTFFPSIWSIQPRNGKSISWINIATEIRNNENHSKSSEFFSFCWLDFISYLVITRVRLRL